VFPVHRQPVGVGRGLVGEEVCRNPEVYHT
jgi:hypothetical protein